MCGGLRFIRRNSRCVKKGIWRISRVEQKKPSFKFLFESKNFVHAKIPKNNNECCQQLREIKIVFPFFGKKISDHIV